jgi:uncharacterized membrane protein YdjX (TVP38/TMEM64 family)
VQKRTIIKFLILTALAALFLYIAYSSNLQDYVSPKAILALLNSMGSFAPLGFMAVMALAVASPLPSLPLDIAAGIFFGPYLGTLYSATGALVGSIISFSIARLLGRSLIERFLRGHINFCSACSDRMLTGVVFFTRLIPVVSFDMVSYGSGLTKMSIWRFSLATFLGMLPLTFIYNNFGAALVVDGRLAIIVGIVVVLLLFLLPVWVERYAPEKLRNVFRHSPFPGAEKSSTKGA